MKTAKLVRLFIGHVAKLEDAAGKEICDLELQALRRAAALEGGLYPTGELLPLCQQATAEFDGAFTPAWVELRNLAPDLTAELERLRSLHDQAVRYYRAYADGDSCEGPHPVEIASVVHSEWRPRLAWLSHNWEPIDGAEGGSQSDNAGVAIVLTADERLVLQILRENSGTSFTQAMLLDELQNRRVYPSEKTLRSCLKRLRNNGLIARPNGPKKGDAITDAGRRMLEN